MPPNPLGWFVLSQNALVATQAQLGAMLGVSRRTAQRWSRSGVPRHSLPDLARLVHPRAPDLAHDIMTFMGSTLEAAGIVAPVSSPAPTPTPATSLPDVVVDALVCAAAEAMDVMPAKVRPGLHAAFVRAKELGLNVDTVERVLHERLNPPPPKPVAPSKARAKKVYGRR
jgi:hypothetical protein